MAQNLTAVRFQMSPDRRSFWNGERWERFEFKHYQQSELPLEMRIAFAVGRGWRVISQTESTAQLVRPKTFSVGLMAFWTIISLGTLFWLYPLYFLTKKDEAVYLTTTSG